MLLNYRMLNMCEKGFFFWSFSQSCNVVTLPIMQWWSWSGIYRYVPGTAPTLQYHMVLWGILRYYRNMATFHSCDSAVRQTHLNYAKITSIAANSHKSVPHPLCSCDSFVWLSSSSSFSSSPSLPVHPNPLNLLMRVQAQNAFPLYQW